MEWDIIEEDIKREDSKRHCLCRFKPHQSVPRPLAKLGVQMCHVFKLGAGVRMIYWEANKDDPINPHRKQRDERQEKEGAGEEGDKKTAETFALLVVAPILTPHIAGSKNE